MNDVRVERLKSHGDEIPANGDATLDVETSRATVLRLVGQVSGSGTLQADVEWQDDDGTKLLEETDVLASTGDGQYVELDVKGTQARITLSETGGADPVTPTLTAFAVRT